MAKSSKPKSFRDSIDASIPAMQFISNPEESATETETIPLEGNVESQLSLQGFVPMREKGELKTKHLHLLIKPSLFKRLQAQSKKANMSINELICQALEYALSQS